MDTNMVLQDSSLEYFSTIPSRVRNAFAESSSKTPFYYADEPFHKYYAAIKDIWERGASGKKTLQKYNIHATTLKELQLNFIRFGAVGLLAKVSTIDIDTRLERLIVLIKSARLHEHSNYALRLANALEIPGATLEIVRRTQRCYGYGQRHDDNDRKYFGGLQKILTSLDISKKNSKEYGHNPRQKRKTFFHRDCNDRFQQRVELFIELSNKIGGRYVRPILKKYGIHQDRYYQLKDRFMQYGVWGLIDLTHCSKRSGEKISPQLELTIIEERLMYPSLTPIRMMDKLDLKCSRTNVQKIYNRWELAKFKQPISIRGIISRAQMVKDEPLIKSSAKVLFPDLIQKSNLKVNREFEAFSSRLKYKKVSICNPGALIIAPFINQLGIIEALHTYGPARVRTLEVTNNILVNILRIIVGFPTINDFYLNSDLSVALGAGLILAPKRTRCYESFDDLRFDHLMKLRNDLSKRAKELGVIECEEIAIDYHCDQSDSRYPDDKNFSKAPDKKGDLVYANRPQIIWDSGTNSIINIAYCEGKSRAPTALYKFLEDNLYKIISPDIVKEIYADSEYTGERQLLYLIVDKGASVTMCLKQNPKIKKWKEETVAEGQWQDYKKNYRIASKDFLLSNNKFFRFVVKQSMITNQIRCFGSTHCDWSPVKILDSYHIRWPVETGIRDLMENYFLNKPTGTSAEKNELHYYCVMAARLAVDLFLKHFITPRWTTPEGWLCVLSTIRTTLFSSQNCNIRIDETGGFVIKYLDGDPFGIKNRLKTVMQDKYELDHWQVPWWNKRKMKIEVIDQLGLNSGAQINN